MGSTFDTIGAARGRRPGERTSYRVVTLDRTTNTIEILHHRFTCGVWTMHFVPNGERTKVDCAVDLTAKRRYLPILPVLRAARGSLLQDLNRLKNLFETYDAATGTIDGREDNGGSDYSSGP
ncbi:MAG TPA: hypothetical protein VGL48_07640 [Acidimicrobiales bacterium]